ncbi:Uncharacterised protein [Streptococcus pneumoniae]|nr:Uncharacterised protein [Streptococcus pneumoniae]
MVFRLGVNNWGLLLFLLVAFVMLLNIRESI